MALMLTGHAMAAVPPVYSDGPYIHYDDDGLAIIRVLDGEPEIGPLLPDEPFEVTSSDGIHRFEVSLRKVTVPDCFYPEQEKITVLSDPHGNMDAFVSILLSAGIMDNDYNWLYGDGHFVLLGDIFDRGPDVLPIFWLVYKLSADAEQAGGMVHFLPGNHESMVLTGDLRYTFPKYTSLAEKLGIEYQELWTPDWVLGEWLSTRNFIEHIGRNVFTHAGLNVKILPPELWLDTPGLKK